MEKNEYSPGKPSGDKLHPMFNSESDDSMDLSYNSEKNSYELDMKDKDEDYDHPLPYDTTAENGGDDQSTYDEANPYIGDEYADKQNELDPELLDVGMRVEKSENIVKVSKKDELLSRTPEDERNDLDEEGYPINNRPKRF